MAGRLVRTLIATGAALFALAPAAHGAVNFDPKQDYTASAPVTLATADLQPDGLLDLVTGSSGTNTISALVGNGDGSFQDDPPENTPAGVAVQSVAAGDLNGDGMGDVVVVGGAGPASSVRVFLRRASGGFESPVPYAAGTSPVDVVLARIDSGNNSLDIAVASRDSKNVHVFLNNGDGTFAPVAPTPQPNGGEPESLDAADFDGDGITDLAVAAHGGGATFPGIYFYKGTGTGAFAPAHLSGGNGLDGVIAGNLNGEGGPDIVAARPSQGDVVIVERTAAGFEAARTHDLDGPGNNTGNPALADFDGDGALDLAVPNYSGAQNRVSVATGNGDGTFADAIHEPVGTLPLEVVAGDFNRDGNPDLASANSGANSVSVLLATPPTVSLTGADFGDQEAGTTSGTRNVTVTNNGAQRLRPGGVSLVGSNADQFTIASNTCTGANLPIGGSCTVGVRFRPTSTGPKSAGVQIVSNGAGTPHAAGLRGTGTTTPPDRTCGDTLNGTAAAETLTGTDRGDNIFGFGGNDVLNGLGAGDCLTGGNGNDRLNGGDGTDTLEGNSGNDVALGGAGNDRTNGGSGRDRLSGGAGNDRLSGVSGNDSLSGGAGNDTLSGSSGNDKLSGGSGKNRYSGGSGNDTVNARNRRARETVDCGPGRDRATVDRGDRVKRCERVSRR